jgi:hypothetical protein
MSSPEGHRQAAEAALSEGRRNPVMSAEQWFRAAEIHALLAIEARLAQIVDRHSDLPDLVASR